MGIRKKKTKKKYIAVFVVSEKGSYSFVGSKKFSPTSKTIKFRKGTYPIDVTYPTYSRGLKLYYFVDVAGNQLKAGETKAKKKLDPLSLTEMGYDPEVLDLVLEKRIVAQLTANLSDNAMKLNILALAIGGLMGGLLGYIIAGVI